ncbi:MAG: MqnA/MqnD/SBP family protein, partial [Daejeonella sp.]
SVFIFSKKPIELLKTIQLDKQSRTSNNLAKVLLKNYWKLQPELVSSGIADAFILIGDRTFGQKNNYAYVYDLAEEWQKFTQLPFVFAVWAANKTMPESFISRFNAALKFGLDHRKEVIEQLPPIENFDLEDYLMNRIDYHFNAKKQEALTLFLTFLKALELPSYTVGK